MGQTNRVPDPHNAAGMPNIHRTAIQMILNPRTFIQFNQYFNFPIPMWPMLLVPDIGHLLHRNDFHMHF